MKDDVPGAPPRPFADTERRVLVIDDDQEMGKAIARLLRPLPVVFAQSAAGALGRLQGGGRFGAVVCDIQMPRMDGFQLYEQVLAFDPALARRIVYVTGGGSTRQLTDFLRRTGCRCLFKPFGGAELRAALAALDEE